MRRREMEQEIIHYFDYDCLWKTPLTFWRLEVSRCAVYVILFCLMFEEWWQTQNEWNSFTCFINTFINQTKVLTIAHITVIHTNIVVFVFNSNECAWITGLAEKIRRAHCHLSRRQFVSVDVNFTSNFSLSSMERVKSLLLSV